MFKEFIDSFLKAAFDPALGLFSQTSGQLLVPNSASSHSAYALCFAVSEMDGSMSYETDDDGQLRPVCGHTHLGFFHFLGKMLGKALYEVCECVDMCCFVGLKLCLSVVVSMIVVDDVTAF